MSMDNGQSFKRFTKNEEQFLSHMWTTLTKKLYPLNKLSVYNGLIEINIREPKCMREINTFYLHADTTLDELWKLIQSMWRVIEQYC